MVWPSKAGEARHGGEGLGSSRQGLARPGGAWRGQARQPRHAVARLGMVRPAENEACRVKVCRGKARLGLSWQAWPGMFRRGLARRGEARRGKARQAGLGLAWQGSAWQGRAGLARRGLARHGRQGSARLGGAWLGAVRLGKARRGNRFSIQSRRFTVASRITLRRSVGGIAPDVVAGELDRLYRQHKEITPTAVVAAARPKGAVLHPAFEWDNRKAGDEYRLWQARQIVRSVTIVNTETGTESPAYVHVTVAQQAEGQYLPAQIVIENVDLFARALSELQGKVRALQIAVAELEGMAREGGDSDRLLHVALAIKALETANTALAAIH